MKRKNNYTNKKKKGKALTITLIISGFIMTGLLIGLGMNDWDVEKSIKKGQEVFGMSVANGDEDAAHETEPTELPDLVEQPDAEETKEEDEPGKVQEVTPESPSKPTKNNGAGSGTEVKPNPAIDNGGYIEGQTLPKEPKFVKGILLANKKYPLPATYAPGEDKKARGAFERMAAEAKLTGFNLNAFSTYRSFEYQTTLYERYVARDGEKAADTYSARPGYSEHQTGLAFDIGEVNFEQHFASSSFGETEAGKWVAANAHRFGFVMRYPVGKEQITGYMHESWHFRYVGLEIADEIFKKNLTLEEYLGVQ
ncbi:M15 family metallopeptidase [Sporosarcina sp. FSL K6-5500]|uniref:M15 family metallopeptidase n=1 Tax=Sporosarcina sp. FSL K6-5500 TaxID=2921558 RepID=UPI0030F93F0E